MRKESVCVTVDAEMFRVLNYYLGKRGANLEGELVDAVNKLYEKCVPAPTREYIDSLRDSQTEPIARSRPRRAARPEDKEEAGEEESNSGS